MTPLRASASIFAEEEEEEEEEGEGDEEEEVVVPPVVGAAPDVVEASLTNRSAPDSRLPSESISHISMATFTRSIVGSTGGDDDDDDGIEDVVEETGRRSNPLTFHSIINPSYHSPLNTILRARSNMKSHEEVDADVVAIVSRDSAYVTFPLLLAARHASRYKAISCF